MWLEQASQLCSDPGGWEFGLDLRGEGAGEAQMMTGVKPPVSQALHLLGTGTPAAVHLATEHFTGVRGQRRPA